ncbi:MAG TPA: ATP-binding protein [Ramlibacter sp.]|uniref:sensor histidine kinase n=1 Tax=Ramlibacter sp. TaxID=1917967 RepID=UPI002C09874B|nr:ATP-binding protein [Ramlibacter sp.]HVZ45631.1 ATP-binding protein [Ramlibacter sp.]
MPEPQKDITIFPQDAPRLEQRLAELDTFVVAASHELRESLFSIGGFARAIELDAQCLAPANRSRLRRIAHAVSKMERAIDDAVALACAERLEMEKRDLPLDEFVRDVLRETQPGYPATRVISSELPIIHADPIVVRHVLVNVITNAFRHSALAPEPAVEVSLDASGALQVIDNGVGFPMTKGAGTFETFVQLTQDPAYLGVGLCLAAAKRLLDRHGGWMRAESRDGGPTRITISFGD